MYCLDDTIAAVSTPPGEGAIGIVRMSGPEARGVLERLLRPARSPAADPEHRVMRFGRIIDPQTRQTADEVLAVWMEAPRSYTRQDVVEIHCHGGAAAVQQVFGLCLREGARPAEPGEFTLRAFANGRIDLSQAEAVLDVIRARTDAALRGSLAQLEGRLAREVRRVRGELLETLAYLTATIDFSEQEVPARDVAPQLDRAAGDIERLLADADRGIIFRQGVRVVIAGRPNVGKSSLLNLLLRVDRAIVTPVPGTTRDTLEETVSLHGIPVVLVDTAGLRDGAPDIAERMGIERTQAALSAADVTLLVVDGSQPLTEADHDLAAKVRMPVVVVHNKSDLPPAPAGEPLMPRVPHVRCSASTGEGIDDLEDALASAILGGDAAPGETPLVSSPRHKAALGRALVDLNGARRAVSARLPADCVTIELRAACDALGEITGETVGDDLLETIFSHFCIGK